MTSKHEKGHEHHHYHCNYNNTNNVKRGKLLWVTMLNFLITLVQIIGGIISNSLSLMSDAIHNLGDSSAIFIAWLAGKYSQKKPDKYRTFGYKRIEILAAFFNGIMLIIICFFILYKAYERFINPEQIKGKTMFIIACFGLIANLISVFILTKDKKHNLNIKAAYLHLLGDTLSSFVVIISGIAIWLFKIYWLDPLITVIISLYIIYHTWDIIKETVDILMQSTPKNIEINEIKNQVEKLEQVGNIHHLHIWKLDDKQTHLEAHINLLNNISMKQMMDIKEKIEFIIKKNFFITHITLQFGYNCCSGNTDLIHTKTVCNI